MRTIIAGSRTVTDKQFVWEKLAEVCKHVWDISLVVEGGAKGADTLGREWAIENQIPVETYLADWNLRGKGAGLFRNHVMAENAGALVAFWDGKSTGTGHMIDTAVRKGLYIKVFYV